MSAAAFGAALLTLAIVFVWNVSQSSTVDQMGADPLAGCNVVDLQIYGTIVGTRAEVPVMDTISTGDGYGTLLTPTYSAASDVRYNLEMAKNDPRIKGLIVDVDTFGGGAAAGHEMAIAIQSFGKPSVAVIHGAGVSSGYMAASGADRIYALEDSTIGSIGATYSYLNYTEKNKKDGIVYEQLSSGPFKDTFSPDKPLTAAERALIMQDLKILSDHFVKIVAENRSLSIDKVGALADGSTMLGQRALENGLIDVIGTWTDARTYIEGIIGEPVSVCWQ